MHVSMTAGFALLASRPVAAARTDSALTVTKLSEQAATIIAGRSYIVEWELPSSSGGGNKVAIDLYHCGEHCDEEKEDNCGEWIASLCGKDLDRCNTEAGAQEVLMPTPTFDKMFGRYKIGVTDLSEPVPVTRCSDGFRLVASEEAAPDRASQAFVAIDSPREGDMAIAGEQYTVKFNYRDGGMLRGGGDDHFTIDLHMSGGFSDECGVWVASLCAESDGRSCRRTGRGLYDITIPIEAKPGFYSISVSRATKGGYIFDCSPEFELISAHPMTVS